jgi:hypothetical protein
MTSTMNDEHLFNAFEPLRVAPRPDPAAAQPIAVAVVASSFAPDGVVRGLFVHAGAVDGEQRGLASPKHLTRWGGYVTRRHS